MFVSTKINYNKSNHRLRYKEYCVRETSYTLKFDMSIFNNKYNQQIIYRTMKLTKKQAIKFINNPNVNPITNLTFTLSEAEMYKQILDAYCNFMNDYLDKKVRKQVITINQSYYCDNFSDNNNNEKQNDDSRNGFIDDCASDTEH